MGKKKSKMGFNFCQGLCIVLNNDNNIIINNIKINNNNDQL